MSEQATIIAPDEPVLITGSNGFIGARVVQTLLDNGFTRLRCFVRPSSNTARLAAVLDRFPGADARLITGNLTVRADCERAAEDAVLVVNCAAGLGGSLVSMFVDSVIASRNLLDALVKAGPVRRIVHLSSFSVYQTTALKRGQPLTEETPLESRHAERNDAYGYVKLRQERLFWSYAREHNLSVVVLRPGSVFGPGGPEVPVRVGKEMLGWFLHLGGGGRIPFTYVDNLAEAVVLAGVRPGIDGQAFNILDDDLPTSRQFLRGYRRARGRLRALPVPYPALLALSHAVAWYAAYSRGQLPAVFTPYGTASMWKGRRFDNSKAKALLGWSPRVPMSAALAAHYDYVRSKKGR